MSQLSMGRLGLLRLPRRSGLWKDEDGYSQASDRGAGGDARNDGCRDGAARHSEAGPSSTVSCAYEWVSGFAGGVAARIPDPCGARSTLRVELGMGASKSRRPRRQM